MMKTAREEDEWGAKADGSDRIKSTRRGIFFGVFIRTKLSYGTQASVTCTNEAWKRGSVGPTEHGMAWQHEKSNKKKHLLP